MALLKMESSQMRNPSENNAATLRQPSSVHRRIATAALLLFFTFCRRFEK